MEYQKYMGLLLCNRHQKCNGQIFVTVASETAATRWKSVLIATGTCIVNSESRQASRNKFIFAFVVLFDSSIVVGI